MGLGCIVLLSITVHEMCHGKEAKVEGKKFPI